MCSNKPINSIERLKTDAPLGVLATSGVVTFKIIITNVLDEKTHHLSPKKYSGEKVRNTLFYKVLQICSRYTNELLVGCVTGRDERIYLILD